MTNQTAAPAADTTAPVFALATVNGATLVLSYTESTTLDAINKPAPGAFAVTADSVSKTVTAVSVDANAKTVTLTLADAVANGQAVTVAYADPTSGNEAAAIQDVAGNDAATLAATSVTNNTPAVDTVAPQLVTATVNGSTLVLTYNEALNAAEGARPAVEAFSVSAGGVSNPVTAVSVDANAKTVTLTLTSAVTSAQTVLVSYTDPTVVNDAAATQDASGNDAVLLVKQAVT